MTARLEAAAVGASLALALLAGFALSQHDDRLALVFMAIAVAPVFWFAAVKP